MLKEVATKLNPNHSASAEITLDAVLDELMERMPTKDFVTF